MGHLESFYECLHELEERIGGQRRLGDGRGPIPRTALGVYFFFEPGEERSASGEGPRVVRVGTQGLTENSKSTLWKRLVQHRGKAKEPGGDHRKSVFRSLVGDALIRRHGLSFPSWNREKGVPKAQVEDEQDLEARVSLQLGSFSYLWLAVDDEPGPDSVRGVIKRNAIALLSNCGKHATDQPSDMWLGRSSSHEPVRESGLWNRNHVDEAFDPAFLETLRELVGRMPPED